VRGRAAGRRALGFGFVQGRFISAPNKRLRRLLAGDFDACAWTPASA
jgi:hypothetical protein